MNHHPPLSALILAAGFGSRITDITSNPKCLLEIAGKTLLQWHFEHLKTLGIKDIFLVVGYKKELIEKHVDDYKKDFNLTLIELEDYRQKGNTYSFYLGLQALQGSFLLFDGDLIYENRILKKIVEDDRKNLILVGQSSLDDIECAKTMVDSKDKVRMLIDKRPVSREEMETLRFVGEAIGIIKFSASHKDQLKKRCEEFFQKKSGNDKLNWEHLMNDFLQDHEMEVHQAASNRWIEIDTSVDYNKAREMFED